VLANGIVNGIVKAVDRWIPRFPNQVSADDQLIHRYYQFLCTIIASFFVVFCANSAYLGLYKLSFGQALILGVIWLSTWVYRRTRSINAAANLILGLSAPVTCYRVFVTDGIESPILFGWPVISTLALMTVSFRWAMVWTAVHLGFASFFFVAHLYRLEFAVMAPAAVLANVRIAMICSVQVILYCSVYCIRQLNQLHRRTLSEQSEKITDLVRALSHDLSSPLMTLRHWTQSALKKQAGDPGVLERTLQDVQAISARITEVREQEARVSGKLGPQAPAAAPAEDGTASSARDAETELNRRLLRYSIVTVSVVFAGFAAYYFALGLHRVAMLQAAVFVASLVAAGLYRFSGSASMAGSLIMAVGLVTGFFQAKWLGGIGSPAFLAWPIIPLFAGILQSARAAGIWSGSYIVMALFYDLSDRSGVVFPTEVSPDASAVIRIVSIFAVQVLAISAIHYLKKQNEAFRQLIERQGARKAELLRTLTRDIAAPLQASLERLSATAARGVSRELDNSVKAAQSSLSIIQNIEALELQARSQAVTVVDAVDLREVVREVAFLQQSAVREKEIHWNESLPLGDGPVLVPGERTSLAYQVLNNLISNAIKFTHPGGSISIEVADRGANWEIHIKDSGIGIPESLLPKLFDQHQQTSRPGTHGEKGTGFGMPIVKRFVERYGGRLSVESITVERDSQRHGTHIRIEFPKVELCSLPGASAA
jgi:signal transduction histidine kinase